MTVVEFPNQGHPSTDLGDTPSPAPVTDLWRRATVKSTFTADGLRYTVAEECWWKEGADMQAAVVAIKESMKRRYRIPAGVGTGWLSVKWTCVVDPKTHAKTEGVKTEGAKGVGAGG